MKLYFSTLAVLFASNAFAADDVNCQIKSNVHPDFTSAFALDSTTPDDCNGSAQFSILQRALQTQGNQTEADSGTITISQGKDSVQCTYKVPGGAKASDQIVAFLKKPTDDQANNVADEEDKLVVLDCP